MSFTPSAASMVSFASSIAKRDGTFRPAARGGEELADRREAERKALSLCGGQENQCKIREWVCT
ncbi:hypothetical protein IE4872_CH03326 [Rhizobium gallicum]|uniref:Uncharacterized protein n=1 Tax=Rhizobium gallicum TaxID=56730 RepID=A0A1L5NLZ6_9HYPH|nr:hypothetical protein [Rhizobium gallicum]APO68926.1 hypothetical protein IE4872_CH03326 [Rhizobium gallicum]